MAEGGVSETGTSPLPSGSDVVYDFYCEPCHDEGHNVEAFGFCQDCEEYLCSDCYHGHRKPRPFRHHRLMDQATMPQTTPLATDRLNTLITNLCEVHPGESVKYFCKFHNFFGCSSCFMSNHRSCKGKESIPDKSKSILDSAEYIDFVENLKFLETTSRDISSRAHQGIQETSNSIEDIRKSVKQLKQKIITTVEKLEQQINTEADNLLKEEEKKMTDVLEQCAFITDAVETMKAEVNALESSRRVGQLYIMLREQCDQIKTLKNILESVDGEVVARKYRFEPDTNLQSLIDKVHSFGKITTELHSKTNMKVGDKSVQEQIDPSLTTPLRVKSMRGSDISLYRTYSFTEYEYITTGSAVLSTNRLIITHESVKLINTVTNTLISTMDIAGEPWDVAVNDKSQVAVTLPKQNKILLLGVTGDKLKLQGKIPVRGVCHGVAFIKDKLLVTYEDDPRIELISMRGKVVKKIQNDKHGNQLFRCPWYVCVGNGKKTVYVSDRGSNRVISLTLDGVVKSTYTDDDLKGPGGLCVDKRDNVYVCCELSRNVHQMTADLTRIQVIITRDELQTYAPLSVSYCRTSDLIYVGAVDYPDIEYMQGDEKIMVFKIT